MKTLQQIEPRIDLQNAPASAVDTTNANYHFIINQPGSYYLSANLGVTKPNGIQINAEGVTLDLNGFEISRASGSGGTGIEIGANKHRASVRNGSIKSFASGIESILGVTFPRGCAFRDLAVSNCTSNGIVAGDGAVLESCRVHDNSGGSGIYAVNGSSLTNCTAFNNTGTYSIFAGFASSLTNCAAYDNTASSGIYASEGSSLTNCTAASNTGTYGIYASSGSSLTNCTASSNSGTYGIYASSSSSLTNCTASSNTSADSISAGIETGSGCTITHCTADFTYSTASAGITTGMGIDTGAGATIKDCTTVSNKADGIRVGSNCIVTGCTSSQNGLGSLFGDGIRTNGDNNRIDGNVVNGNSQYGIRTSGTSIVVRNNATGNATANYNVSAGANIGPIQTPNTATSPWANF